MFLFSNSFVWIYVGGMECYRYMVQWMKTYTFTWPWFIQCHEKIPVKKYDKKFCYFFVCEDLERFSMEISSSFVTFIFLSSSWMFDLRSILMLCDTLYDFPNRTIKLILKYSLSCRTTVEFLMKFDGKNRPRHDAIFIGIFTDFLTKFFVLKESFTVPTTHYFNSFKSNRPSFKHMSSIQRT